MQATRTGVSFGPRAVNLSICQHEGYQPTGNKRIPGKSGPTARVSKAETVQRIRSIKHCGGEFGEHPMREQDDIEGFVRAVRTRVPMDAV